MKYFKTLIIIVLMLAYEAAFGQGGVAVLDEIDFNDTTMINSDFMWKTIADYITSEQNKMQILTIRCIISSWQPMRF